MTPSAPYLVIDMRRLLDESQVGSAAAGALQTKLAEAQARLDALRGEVARAESEARLALEEQAIAFRNQATEEFEAARAKLRAALLSRARPILERMAAERGVDLVIDRGAAVLFREDADITDAVMREVDAGGPL